MARFEFMAGAFGEQGSLGGGADALFELGLMYSSGRDVDVDLVEAHKWFNLAALRGNVAARQYRAEVASELSRAEIAQAQRRAREWLAIH